MGLIDQAIGQLSTKSVAVFVAASCTIYLVLVSVERRRRRSRLGARAPRAKYYIPFGIDFVINGILENRRNRNLQNWVSQFGRIGAWTAEANIAGHEVILTAEPDNIKAVLSTQFADYGKGADFHADFRDFLGDSIFATDGELWHSSRQLVRPQFIKDRVSDLHCFEDHTQALFRAIANGGPLDGGAQVVDLEEGNGRKVDISDLFYRLALDVSTDFLFGYSVDSMFKPNEPFAEAFDEVQRVQGLIARAKGINWIIPRSTFWPGLKTIDSFVNQYIDRALALGPDELASKTKSDKGYTFLHAVAGFTRDRKVLRDQIVALLLAGRDTTASTLSFAVHELARHPDVVAKLRREILATVGPDTPPTYRDLKNMAYLKAVVNETLRLYPVVPFNVRVALRDTTLPRGGGPDGTQPVGVLKDTSIAYSTLVMQRRADIYPPVSETFADPALFSPERWENWHPKGHEYVPFNAGPRICVGQQFALTEMAYVICRMFQKYERVESFVGPEKKRGVGGEDEDLSLKTDLTLKPGERVVVAFWEAKRQ